MSESALISTIDDAILYALESVQNEHTIIDFNFKNQFDIEIILNGDYWDGKIDYKICQIVLELQKDILGFYKKATGNHISISNDSDTLKKLSVKFTLEKNCTKIFAEISKLVSSLKESGMTGKQISIFIFSLLASIAALTLPSTILGFIERKNQAEALLKERMAHIEANQKDKERLEKIIMKGIESASENIRAQQRIANAIEHRDTVTINGVTFTKNEAVYSFVKEQTPEEHPNPITCLVDGKYKIISALMERQQVEIAYKGAKTFFASTKDIPHEEKQYIYKIFADADAMGYAPTVDLQMRIEVTNGIITGAAIEHTGAPRPQAISLFKALDMSTAKDSPKKIQQGRLLE